MNEAFLATLVSQFRIVVSGAEPSWQHLSRLPCTGFRVAACPEFESFR